MDVFAHAAAGALLGRAVRPTGDRWVAMAVYGAAAGLCPDIDAPLALLGHEAWFEHHQLYTHSLVGLLWVPLLLASIPRTLAPMKTRYTVALAGWALHVLMDVVARWPVPVPWPLSSERWALYLIAQDFSLTIDVVLVVGLLATLYDPLQPLARPIALGTAALVTVWLAAGLPT